MVVVCVNRANFNMGGMRQLRVADLAPISKGGNRPAPESILPVFGRSATTNVLERFV